jgi:GT2 family glycosyltransferase
MGAGVVIRRRAFDAAGGFDESFHMFYEEVDLCFRLQKLGWQVHFAPVAEIVHMGGASTRQARAEMAVHFYTSLMQFYRLHYSRMRQAELIVLVQCIALARLARDTLRSGLTTDSERRVQLAANRQAWRRLARGEWR